MFTFLFYLFIVLSLSIILIVLAQPSEQQDTLSLLSTDQSSPLFKYQKARGLRYVLQYLTIFLGLAWLVLGVVLMVLGQ